MKYQFKATDQFWKKFYDLSPSQKESMRKAWQKFKDDPFDKSLGTHIIHSLSGRAKRNIYSVVIEGDLRVLFFIKKGVLWSFDLGGHSIYR